MSFISCPVQKSSGGGDVVTIPPAGQIAFGNLTSTDLASVANVSYNTETGELFLGGGSGAAFGNGDVTINGAFSELGTGGNISITPGSGGAQNGNLSFGLNAGATNTLCAFSGNAFSSGYIQFAWLNNGIGGIAALDIRMTSSGNLIGFFNAEPVAQPTGVAISAAAIHAALVSLGLITA